MVYDLWRRGRRMDRSRLARRWIWKRGLLASLSEVFCFKEGMTVAKKKGKVKKGKKDKKSE